MGAKNGNNERVPKKRRPIRLAFLLVVALGALVVVLRRGDFSSPSDASAHAASLHFGVGVASCTFVDETRSVQDYATGVISRGRVLATQLYYPTLSGKPHTADTPLAPVARRDGPYGVIVFGHGYDLDPGDYAPLLNAWVKAGFVVVAPAFPDTNAAAVAADHDSSLPESDVVNQPLDLAYVTQQLEANASGRTHTCPLVHGLLVAGAIGLAGQSDGATSAAMLGYNSTPGLSTSAVHYRGVAVLSGALWPWPKGAPDPYRASASSPPLLVVQSAADECNPPQAATTLYNDIPEQKKWFLELYGVGHLPPYTGTNPTAFNVVAKVTTAFFEQTVLNESSSGGLGAATKGHGSVARLVSGGVAPTIPALEDEPGTCYRGV